MGTTHEMTAKEAYTTLGITPHDREMRTRFQECFACRAQLNFMRLYVEAKQYCPTCESATGDRKRAVELINDL